MTFILQLDRYEIRSCLTSGHANLGSGTAVNPKPTPNSKRSANLPTYLKAHEMR